MGATILLADDSITIQKVIELTFGETEHRVVAVGSGRDLLERLGTLKPDAVLCDVVMPDANGYDICRTLKSDPATLHIPVVLLTGTFEPFDRSRALAAGCDAIITKPFEAEELIRTVEELLRRKPQGSVGGLLGLEAVGVPEGVPALDFTTTGFERMGAKEPPYEPGIPEEGLEFSSTGVVAPAHSADAADLFGPEEASVPAAAPPHDLPAAQELEGSAGEEETFPSAPPGLRQEPQGPFSELPEEGVQEEPALVPPEMEGPPLAVRVQGFADRPESGSVPSGGPPAEPAGVAATMPFLVSRQLSDQELEQVARKVLELATPLLERIAWEVIPDMAEMLVRQRIRELEQAAE